MFELKTANKVLNTAAGAWLATVVIGQWIFFYYIAVYYGGRILEGGLPALADTHLPAGYIAGQTVGNLATAAHVLLALVIHGFGPLQLIPQIRSRFRAFHRWNGRIFLVCAVLSAIAGFYMTWFRGFDGTTPPDIAISTVAVLILVFAVLALRYAIARDINMHRRWALRLFLVSSAVWFGRLLIYPWLYIIRTEGISAALFESPVYFTITFAQFLIPLGILEIYLHVQRRGGMYGRYLMAAGLFVVTTVMVVGIYAATRHAWLPRVYS